MFLRSSRRSSTYGFAWLLALTGLACQGNTAGPLIPSASSSALSGSGSAVSPYGGDGVPLNGTLGTGPGLCPRDSKLIGQVEVFGDEFEASWWRLIYNGMVEYGFTTSNQQRDYLNGVFGTSFGTPEEVRDFNLQGISDSFDKNQNGYVCAYDLRGTRAYNDDPLFTFTWFGVSDDKIR